MLGKQSFNAQPLLPGRYLWISHQSQSGSTTQEGGDGYLGFKLVTKSLPPTLQAALLSLSCALSKYFSTTIWLPGLSSVLPCSFPPLDHCSAPYPTTTNSRALFPFLFAPWFISSVSARSTSANWAVSLYAQATGRQQGDSFVWLFSAGPMGKTLIRAPR